jgi:hypothetical protein
LLEQPGCQCGAASLARCAEGAGVLP